MSKKELAEELHKPIIRKFNKRKAHSSFIDNIRVADLASWHATKGIRFSFVLLIFSVNTHGLYLSKINEVSQLLMPLKNLNANQTKYG